MNKEVQVLNNKSDLVSSSISPESKDQVKNAELESLSTFIAKYAPHDGSFDLSVGGPFVIRASETTKESIHMMSEPGI